MLAWLKEDFDFTNKEIFQDLDIQKVCFLAMKNTGILTKQGYVCYIDNEPDGDVVKNCLKLVDKVNWWTHYCRKHCNGTQGIQQGNGYDAFEE